MAQKCNPCWESTSHLTTIPPSHWEACGLVCVLSLRAFGQINLVKEQVYLHENDLLMLMEMLHYDKLKGTKALAEKKIINDEYGHRNILRKYDNARHEMKSVLFEKGLIQDEEAFAKILYLLDTDTKIIPGEKEFTTGMSLREIADVLMASK